MVLLLACAGTLTYDGLTDEARTAMRLVSPGETTAVYWIANTPVACEPEAVDDDPTTIVDERADAQLWWLAQVNGAFTREDALDVVILATAGTNATYDVYNPMTGASDATHSAVVGYYKVREAELSEFSQYWFEYEVTRSDEGLAEGSVDVSTDRLVSDLDGDAPAFDTPYTICENQTLRNLLSTELQLVTGA